MPCICTLKSKTYSLAFRNCKVNNISTIVVREINAY